jgi:formylglycine-generating enzyme required for sulfatase activity/proteasome lid subunit RPN8/RPN11
MSGDDVIVLPAALFERLVTTVRSRLPRKSFGYLVSDVGPTKPTDFILFNSNVRNDRAWKGRFEAYGRYFVDHADAGFVASAEESWRLQKEIWARGMVEVGTFHSHRRHPANFSQIDYDMHVQRVDSLWHLIVSMRNPAQPQVRAFGIFDGRVRELDLRTTAGVPPGAAERTPVTAGVSREVAIARARQHLQLDRAGQPACHDARLLLGVIDRLLSTHDEDAIQQILVEGFLRDSERRYREHVEPQMHRIEGCSFTMGTDEAGTRHFCGESPPHVVTLSPLWMSRFAVTNELHAQLDRRRLDVPRRDRKKPVVEVTWFDATLLAIWMGCRLPTEAEWEFAAGAGSQGEWCCEREHQLSHYAWYSENSRGEIHPVGTRQPNTFGLFDLHGNVWEWCQDGYDQQWYRRSPMLDPVNLPLAAADDLVRRPDMVCRGGSMHALAEMCRTRFRFHEPPGFQAADLGFRLARAAGSPGMGHG